MLDGAIKTIPVDESQPVGSLMLGICTKIGISNYDEYSLVSGAFDSLDTRMHRCEKKPGVYERFQLFH